jgi:Mor family transcriptional regulator
MADLFSADDGKHLGVLHEALPDGLHATLVDMAEQMYLALVEDAEAVQVLGRERLAAIVVEQVDRVALRCGGGQFYLPKGLALKLSQRDREIFERFNGRNKRELAREFGVTEMRIDQIVAAVRRAEFERRQGKIDFDD